MVSDRQPHLSVAMREELGDCRLVLDSAAHNVRAALGGDEVVQSLDNAIVAAEQALVALKRIRSGMPR